MISALRYHLSHLRAFNKIPRASKYASSESLNQPPILEMRFCCKTMKKLKQLIVILLSLDLVEMFDITVPVNYHGSSEVFSGYLADADWYRSAFEVHEDRIHITGPIAKVEDALATVNTTGDLSLQQLNVNAVKGFPPLTRVEGTLEILYSKNCLITIAFIIKLNYFKEVLVLMEY